jgi:hypothetical protein
MNRKRLALVQNWIQEKKQNILCPVWNQHMKINTRRRFSFFTTHLFFFWRRAPQQKLRTHRSLEAYRETLWWRWLIFFVFPCNRAPVEWNWQGKTEVLDENPVPVPLCPPQIPHGLTWDRTRASVPHAYWVNVTTILAAGRQRIHGPILGKEKYPDCLWANSVLSSAYRGTFPGGVKWLGHEVHQWLLFSAEFQECVQLHLHPPICLQAVQINSAQGQRCILHPCWRVLL